MDGVGAVDVEGDYLPHVVACENGGADYEAIFAAGGGILSSVRQTRALSDDALHRAALARLHVGRVQPQVRPLAADLAIQKRLDPFVEFRA